MSRLTQAIDENRRRAKEQQEETTTRQSGGKSVLRQAIDQARSGERVERATGVPPSQNSVGLNMGRDGVSITPSQARPSVASALPSVPSLSSSLRRFTPTQLLQDVLKQSETTRPAVGQTTTPTETMSSADMSAQLDELRELRDEAEKARNEARLIMTGSRYMTSSMREEQQAILDQAEADYSRYEQEYNELLGRYYQTENEEKRASLQQDEAMSGQYQSAQDIQADMDKVSAVMAYTVTHDGDAAQVEEYKQYLFDKYGLDQKAVDQYAISGAGGAYVPRTDGGYNNIYELYLELQEKKENAVSTLSEGGYDYERMTGYEDMLEDAAQYREDMGEWREYAREHPILSSVDTLLTAPFQGFDFLRVMGQNIGHSDRDDPENYVPMNSYDMELTNYINAVRQTVSEEIEGATNWEIFDQNVAAFLYQTGMSIGDSSLNLLAFGPTGALVVGSSTAAANQAKDIIDRGGSKEQAFMGGMAAGAFEAIFEKVSIDNLLATKSVTGWKSWLKETAKQAGIEASEETFTEIANILADAAIMGDNSNYDVAVAEYVAQGMSQEDAERQAFFDLIGQVVQAGVGGAISGGVMGGAVNGVNGMANAAYNRYNQQLVQENDVKNTPILETNPQEGPVQSQNEGEIDSSIPEAARQAVEMLVRGEEISGNQAARIAESEEAVALLSQLTGEEVNTDAPISRVKSDIRALASREGRTSGEAGVNSQATQSGAQTALLNGESQTDAEVLRSISQVRRAAAVLGENGSRAMTAAYDETMARQYAPEQIVEGFYQTYNAALEGRELPRVSIPDQVRLAAESSARLDRTRAEQAKYFGENAGLRRDETQRRANLSSQDERRLDALGKALGVEIRFAETVDDGAGRQANAKYGNGTITLSLDADDPVFTSVIHEAVHRIRETDPDSYTMLADYVQSNMSGEGLGHALGARSARYGTNSLDLLTEEAVADAFGRMVNKESLDRLARDDRGVVQKVLDVVRDIIAKIRRVLSGKEVNLTDSQRAEFRELAGRMGEMERLFAEALEQARQAAGQNESAAQADGAGRFSIRYDQDNNPYVVIEEDILAGVPRSEWVRTVKDNLRQKFPNGVTVGRNVIEINAQSRREMTFSKYVQRLMRTDRQIFADKLRATNNADEILRAARNWVNEALLHPRRDAIIDFARGEVLMRIGSNDYAAQVIVGNRGGGNLLLYDIINLEQTEIQEKRTGTDYITKPQNGTGDRQSAPASDDSISETGGDVNGKYSLKERDREYLSAVESGNTQEAQRLVDEAAEAAMPESKIRGQDGRLTPVYHGTRDMFWRFDTAVKGGVNGTAEGFGIYTSDNPAVTSAYGDRQLKMFANITHPATSTEKTITPKTLAALIKDTCEREARQQVADGEYDSVREALRDTWVSNYTDTYSAPMPQVYREVARSILDMNDSDMEVIQEVMTGMGIRDYADATSFYENSLIPVTGIDGFVTQWESGDTGERSNIILALNSSQLKSADAVTRDDSGNVIPLSERFDPSEGDIRYSLKSTDSQGRELSEEQRRYFQGSKITDADGRLLVLYHGTTAYGEITKFRRGRSGWLGPGIYLASRQADAKRYADAMGEGNGQLYELYANATNPLVVTEGNPVPEILRAAYGRDSVYRSRSAKQGNDAQIITTADIKKLQSKGYDGIRWDFGGSTEVSVFSPEQIKRVDNLTPSGSQDVRYSLKAEDSQGRELTQEQQEFFRDSKVVDAEGRLLVLYHQTDGDFTVFDPRHAGAGTTDSETPSGVFLKPTAEDIGLRGKRQMKLYANITNPLSVRNRAELSAWYRENIRGYTEADANVREIEQVFHEEYEAAEARSDAWYEENYDDYAAGRITEEEAMRHITGELDEILARWKAEEGEARQSVKALLNDYFSKSRYDGVHILKDAGSLGRSVETWIALRPEQVKNTDNLNPTSDPDIRYSLSNREQLEEYIREYGPIPQGERPYREVRLPRRTSETERLSQTARTILEVQATPEAAIPSIEALAADGTLSYEPYTDRQAMGDAENTIRDKGYATALSDWTGSVRDGKVSKRLTAEGWTLYNQAANDGDIKSAMTILTNMVEHQRNAAQALQATRILKKLSPDAQLYGVVRSAQNLTEELVEKYGDKAPELHVDEELAARFLAARTERERDRAMQDLYRDIGRQMPSRFADKWNAWRYLAMLGNPRTHVRNIVGNAFFAPVVAAKDLTATAIEAAVSRVSGGKLTRTKALVGPRDRALLTAAWGDYGNAEERIMGGGKYSETANANRYIQEGRVIFKNPLLEWGRRANSRALDLEDTWFSRPHYAYALSQYAKANGITAEQIRSGKGLDEARAYAVREAQKATYRDTNAFSEMISDLGRYRGKNPAKRAASMVLEGILPFRKTPANILVRGVEYSPLGLLKSLSYDLVQVGRGKLDAASAIDHISAGLTGTGLMALGMFLAAEGLVRGAGEGDDKEREFDELRGHQAYSLELGGQSYTLDWLAPEALPFFVGVNLWEQTQAESEDVTLSAMLQAAGNVTEPLLEMSCLQSLNDVFDAVGYASSAELGALASALASASTSYLTQAIPSLFGQFERTGQDIRMTTYTERGTFLTPEMQYTAGRASSRIPGWDYQQIPYIDAWGRTEAEGPAWARAADNFLNPAYRSAIETSPMEDELERLYGQTGEAGVLPSRAARYFTVDGERKDLTAEEYVKFAQEQGQTAYDILTELTAGAAYQAASDAERVEMVEMAYEYAVATAKAAVSGYQLDGWVKKAQAAAKKANMPVSRYIPLYVQQKGIGSLKDADGETIDNSRSLLVMEMVYAVKGLTDKQRQQLFEDFGVGKSVRHYNQALVKEKLEQMRRDGK